MEKPNKCFLGQVTEVAINMLNQGESVDLWHVVMSMSLCLCGLPPQNCNLSIVMRKTAGKPQTPDKYSYHSQGHQNSGDS